mmetsp:Transcript_3929/g.10301  ORF Transcript_3929/g.10301 Transcript_3929/m.10301 type:complete len:244 (+) Transcript_3929:355-1086(+)
MVASLFGISQSWCTVTLQSHYLSWLRSRRNLDSYLAVNDRCFDRVTENGIKVTDGFLGINFRSLTTKVGVFFNSQKDIKVSCWSAIGTGVSFPSHTKFVSIFDSRRDCNLDLFRFLVESLTTANSTIFFNLLSSSSTCGTSLLSLEVSKRCSGDLNRYTTTTTLSTSVDLAARFHTVPITCVTGLQVSNSDLFFAPKHSRFEVNFQVESKIISDHGSPRLRSSSSATEACTAAHAATHATTKE